MKLEGGCQCGAVRYSVSGQPEHVALCHCADCRKSSGAPVMSWAAFAAGEFELTKGQPAVFNSSGASMRYFCPTCGSGLYFVNEEALPGLIDIQSATLDDPDALTPQVQIQVAERVNWMTGITDMPEFERFPG